jgi:hypothetical protein
MALEQYVALGNITLTSNATQVDFSSIAGDYKDLMLVMAPAITTSTITAIQLKLNNDSSSNYTQVWADGDGTNAVSSSSSSQSYIDIAVIAQTVGANIANIFDYSSTNKHKTIITRYGNTEWGTRMLCGRWTSTSAITSVSLIAASSTIFAPGSTFSLYGVR